MQQRSPSEARSLGACLDDLRSPLRRVLDRAGELAALQAAVRLWIVQFSPRPPSVEVSLSDDGTLTIYADSAAALTQIRYRQRELLDFLKERGALDSVKLHTKIMPAVPAS